MKMNVVLLLGLVITSLASTASAIAGTATYYTVYVPSACYGNSQQGTLIAAANPSLYNNGAACGRMYRVTCTGGTNNIPTPCRGGSVTVKIVDLCLGCLANRLYLSQEAFSQIANPDAGRVKIDFTPYDPIYT
ncbi:hypothetical protein L6164_035401 [Bauhinia variegata]|uniref:Uncharacterized protein n=1 Tax=Bauhinia variegata TaxID=167791 RepID=A0ACB9KDT5_BAUVA|nr:hypothetical protein L6164_035401 [Bauhinia variegata]